MTSDILNSLAVLMSSLEGVFAWFFTPIELDFFGGTTPFELILGGFVVTVLVAIIVKWIIDFVT